MAIEKKFVREQVNRLLIKEFLHKETERAGFGGLDIQRTPMGTRVSLVVERPGMVIGRRGATIQKLTADLSNNFDAENPQIEVVEAGRNANLNAGIMAAKVAEALERGWHFRRAGHSTVRRIMESGAKGVIVILSGKLTGQRHRMEKFIAGHIKYNGDTAIQLMDVGYSQCKKKLGTIGCTVKIMHPDARLPDEVTVYAPGEKGRLDEPVERTEPVDEKPAVEEAKQEEAEVKATPSEGATEDKPRRPRRREPRPEPTEADLAEAKALAQTKKAKRADASVHVTKGEGPEEGKEPESKAEDAGEAPSRAETDAAVTEAQTEKPDVKAKPEAAKSPETPKPEATPTEPEAAPEAPKAEEKPAPKPKPAKKATKKAATEPEPAKETSGKESAGKEASEKASDSETTKKAEASDAAEDKKESKEGDAA